MNRFYRYIILSIFFIVLTGCTTAKSVLESYEDQTVIYSNANNDVSKTINFSFESDDENLLCLGFLDKFKEDIVVYVNDKLMMTFHRNEGESYKKLSNEEIFKFIYLNNPNENKITIGLIQTKKKINFIIDRNKRFFLISHYNQTWFVTAWDN